MSGAGAGMETANPWVEPNFLQSAIYRPACRLQTQIRAVPSENGGRREGSITRCIHPGVSSLARPAGEDSGPYAADGNRPDDEAFGITSATTVAAGLREPNVRIGGGPSEQHALPPRRGGMAGAECPHWRMPERTARRPRGRRRQPRRDDHAVLAGHRHVP